MSLKLSDREIRRVRLIDDNPAVRATYRYSVEDMSLVAEEVIGPIEDFGRLIDTFDVIHDAVICDFQLTASNYSRLTGDWLVADLYVRQIPAVLCTRWAGPSLPEEVRFRRRQIPFVLRPNELEPEVLFNAFNLCTKEFAGRFSSERKPWRAVIRIEGAEANGPNHFRLAIVVPSFDPNIGISFVVPTDKNKTLREIAERAAAGEIVRAFGQVNLGANSEIDIYIDEWTLPL